MSILCACSTVFTTSLMMSYGNFHIDFSMIVPMLENSLEGPLPIDALSNISPLHPHLHNRLHTRGDIIVEQRCEVIPSSGACNVQYTIKNLSLEYRPPVINISVTAARGEEMREA